MKHYKVRIVETLVMDVDVEAESGFFCWRKKDIVICGGVIPFFPKSLCVLENVCTSKDVQFMR